MTNIFKGLITAIITPFKNGKLDFDALEKIFRYQIENNVDGIVVAGSTGEGNSLSVEEYKLLIQNSVEIARKQIPIIVGCSSNNTSFVTDIAMECTKIGVDGFMATVPSYIKPTQEGIYKHFESIHNASNLPIMLYSVPSRTSVDFSDETIWRLSKLPRIMALKDADRDSERPLRIKAKVKENFNLLSGNDEVTLSYNAQGGIGCVSVASNIVPKLCKKLQDSWGTGNIAEALRIQQQLLPLYKALFAESNPIPVKYAAHHLGLCSDEIRLPLTEATNNTKMQIRETMLSFFKEEIILR